MAAYLANQIMQGKLDYDEVIANYNYIVIEWYTANTILVPHISFSP